MVPCFGFLLPGRSQTQLSMRPGNRKTKHGTIVLLCRTPLAQYAELLQQTLASSRTLPSQQFRWLPLLGVGRNYLVRESVRESVVRPNTLEDVTLDGISRGRTLVRDLDYQLALATEALRGEVRRACERDNRLATPEGSMLHVKFWGLHDSQADSLRTSNFSQGGGVRDAKPRSNRQTDSLHLLRSRKPTGQPQHLLRTSHREKSRCDVHRVRATGGLRHRIRQRLNVSRVEVGDRHRRDPTAQGCHFYT